MVAFADSATINIMENPRQIVQNIIYRPKERINLFRELELQEREAVFELLSPYVQQNILEGLEDSEVVDLLDQMDLQRAENTITRIKSHRRRKKIISRLKKELKEKADHFLRFHPKAAITLLNFNYLYMPGSATIGEVADAIDRHYQEVGKFPEVLVHENGEFAGEVLMSALVREDNDDLLKKHFESVKTISYEADAKEIIDLFKKSKHGKVVVLDKDESIIGIIYSDDALSLLGKPAASLYDFAGVSDMEGIFDSVWSKVRRRYRWLIINLGTAFLAALTVGFFRESLDELVLLAIYMPIVAGMGGNAATQTLAVVVRGIALGETKIKESMPIISREMSAGFINGVMIGIIVAIIAMLWNQNPLLGLIIGISIVVNLVVAGFFGAFIPLLMKSIGKDPATSATIFITTATDVLGFFTFLGLATLLLF